MTRGFEAMLPKSDLAPAFPTGRFWSRARLIFARATAPHFKNLQLFISVVPSRNPQLGNAYNLFCGRKGGACFSIPGFANSLKLLCISQPL
jgi:hypothetical protein